MAIVIALIVLIAIIIFAFRYDGETETANTQCDSNTKADTSIITPKMENQFLFLQLLEDMTRDDHPFTKQLSSIKDSFWNDFEFKIYKFISLYIIYNWFPMYRSMPDSKNSTDYCIDYSTDYIILRKMLIITAIEEGFSSTIIDNVVNDEKFTSIFNKAKNWTLKSLYGGSYQVVESKIKFDICAKHYKESPSLVTASLLKQDFNSLWNLL